jgi:hypothetical protein
MYSFNPEPRAWGEARGEATNSARLMDLFPNEQNFDLEKSRASQN